MAEDKEKHIITSWEKNASAWKHAIRTNQIESRVLATNQAIIDAVLSAFPKRVLDVGCGEGWLTKYLYHQGIDSYGVDASPKLIEFAREKRFGNFQTMPYHDIKNASWKEKFDVVVCNFSLFGKASVEHFFSVVPDLLLPGGHFIVQTLHPISACGEHPYEDGWRKGSWQGFSSAFCDPAPWYFRTVDSWLNLFAKSGFSQVQREAPLHPTTYSPLSVIFIAKL